MPPASNCQFVFAGEGSDPVLAAFASQYDAESNTASFLLYAVALSHAPWLLIPTGPWDPCGPGSPGEPCGMRKLRTAAFCVPPFNTEAGVPAGTVTVAPTLTVAAAPGTP